VREFSHVDEHGRAKMVDVTAKPRQLRTARASGAISLSESTVALIAKNRIKKGDVLTVARVAGIQAAKRTAELVPLCHPLELTKVDVGLSLKEQGAVAESEVSCVGRTGVEMEAMTAVTVALLTVYDMCKAVDKSMRIENVYLRAKTKQDMPADDAETRNAKGGGN